MLKTEIELVRDGAVVRVISVEAAPLRIGRQVDNGLILADEDVSAYHAVLTPSDAGLIVHDLRSTNGTWLNGVRVTGTALLSGGDEVRIGGLTVLRLRHIAAPALALLAVRDVVANTLHVVGEDRVTFGSAPGCTFELPGALPRAATLQFIEEEVWLDTPDTEARPIALGEAFEVAGRPFVVEPAPIAGRSTRYDRDVTRYGYAIEVTLAGPGGPVATLNDPGSGAQHVFIAENRSTLLYVLARKRANDLAAGAPGASAGWMDDEEVVVAVWGRGAMLQATSNYSVLLHRIRREVESAGFDPGFLEKRRGASRLRLDLITVH